MRRIAALVRQTRSVRTRESWQMAQTAQVRLSESLRRVEAEIAAGHPDLALTRCQELQALYPRALAIHRVMGEVYLALRKPREALGALDRALGGDPEDARACCARAIVHQMHGDSLSALAWYRRACDIRPDDEALRATYAELAAPLGQPPYRPTPVGLARLYLRGGLFSHAIREWEMLSAEYPDLLEAQVGLAETLWRAQRPQAAADRCRRILANAPSCVKALLLLAVMSHDGGSDAEAQRLAQRAAELDPDQRIAQTLFADRLAAGDSALRQLVLGEERAPASQPARTDRAVVRPLTGQLGMRAPASGGTGDLSPQPGTPAASSRPLNSIPSRSSALPPEFHSIFSEAEYMIWGPDEEGRAGRGPAADSTAPRGDRAPSSQPLVPPAISEQGANMDETEVRQAVNWVHWLQAQGARVHPGALVSTSPLGPNRPPREATPGQRPPAPGTGPLPPPTPEALRSMFAELAPDVGSSGRGVVEADVVSSSNERAPAPSGPQAPDTRDTPDVANPRDAREAGDAREAYSAFGLYRGPDDQHENTPAPTASAPSAPLDDDELASSGAWYEQPTEHDPNFMASGAPAWSGMSAAADDWSMDAHGSVDAMREQEDAQPTAVVESAPAAYNTPRTPSPSRPAAEASQPDATLEGLERQFAASGFHSFEPHPGALAALAGESAGQSAQAAPEVQAAAPMPSPEPLPAPDDYPARLERARQLRAEGRMDEALVEYRAILKNAPSLLDTVLDELHDTISAMPEHPDVHRLLGDARIRQGDYLGALESYNRAVALAPAND